MPQSAAVRAAHEDDLSLLRQEGNPRSHDFNSATLMGTEGSVPHNAVLGIAARLASWPPKARGTAVGQEPSVARPSNVAGWGDSAAGSAAGDTET